MWSSEEFGGIITSHARDTETKKYIHAVAMVTGGSGHTNESSPVVTSMKSTHGSVPFNLIYSSFMLNIV